MAGAAGRREHRERIAAEAEARRAEIAENGGSEFVADPNASFQEVFLDAIGLEKGAIWGYKGAWTDAGVEELARDAIGEMEPNEFLDAVAKAQPEMSETIGLIKADPELSEALHTAIVNDPTMLAGLQEIVTAEGSGADLNEILTNDMQRGVLTQVLGKIGDGSVDAGGDDVDFSHLQTILEARASGDNNAMITAVNDTGVNLLGSNMLSNLFSGGSFTEILQSITELLRNPGQFIDQFVSSIEGLSPEWENRIGAVLDGGSRLTAGFIDPQGDFLGYYGREFGSIIDGVGDDYGRARAARQEAGTSFERTTGTQTTTSNLDGVTSRTSFDPAATGQSVIDDAATLAETVVKKDTEVAAVEPTGLNRMSMQL